VTPKQSQEKNKENNESRQGNSRTANHWNSSRNTMSRTAFSWQSDLFLCIVSCH